MVRRLSALSLSTNSTGTCAAVHRCIFFLCLITYLQRHEGPTRSHMGWLGPRRRYVSRTPSLPVAHWLQRRVFASVAKPFPSVRNFFRKPPVVPSLSQRASSGSSSRGKYPHKSKSLHSQKTGPLAPQFQSSSRSCLTDARLRCTP